MVSKLGPLSSPNFYRCAPTFRRPFSTIRRRVPPRRPSKYCQAPILILMCTRFCVVFSSFAAFSHDDQSYMNLFDKLSAISMPNITLPSEIQQMTAKT